MKTRLNTTLFVSALSVCLAGHAGTSVQMHLVNKSGVGKPIGEVEISENQYGLVFTPALKGLPEGLHGFHVHENPSCQPEKKGDKITPAGAAGGHYDPDNAKKHGAPWGNGHLGDLPSLYVTPDGRATHPVLAPRLEMSDLKGRALMIHEGGDNYSDQPKPLGGGGSRIACGVIEGSE